MSTAASLGDMSADEFRAHGHAIVEWIARYMEHPERYPVLARVAPGDIRRALPAEAPDSPEPFDGILADFDRILMPGMTHWNHPGFMAYFATSASGPGVLAEFLSAALNQQAMLWRTSPSATELEAVALGWLRRLLGLPDSFAGVIYDTASMSSLHALAAAREAAVPHVRRLGLAGRADVPRLRVYCSDQAHSSIDKGVILAGFGHEALRRIPCDAEFRLPPDALGAAIAEDRSAGVLPVAVVATVGTTSTTSVDPVAEVAGICEAEGLWLHVDAAYAGAAAMLPEHAHILAGAERADSLVVNPHKWLFTPFDLSAFFCRRMDVLRQAFSLVPEYLRTPEAAANLMDTGVQLGRRFRALKLWMLLRYFGADGLRGRIRHHVGLGRQLARWVDAHPDFERLAPAPFSVVCFRARPRGREWSEAGLARLNEAILARVNASGEVFISHTVLHGRFALRAAIGNLQTTERHVARAWELVQEALDAELA
ncbi:MAG TPA: pyridoxal-dependent decarboxylase [Vicinamibacterales bacterium]|nr:pyridoxal-dependent decarboxylase [Vicinamibacterales bacterium]HOQ58982.1 pyridoxal-dependent decarboxylase [Vicinamibacterales bacterium]HPK70426.1 pyridoxal-dependent decarboxylase [Vicinamibacterales bacterium]